MSTFRSIPSDPVAAAVHLRIEQLRRDADAYRLVREVRDARRRAGVTRRPASVWPAAVATALRESLSGAPAAPSAEVRAGVHHGAAPCGA
jgi:hypothetical protein